MKRRIMLSLSVFALFFSGVMMVVAEMKPDKLTAVVDVIHRDLSG